MQKTLFLDKEGIHADSSIARKGKEILDEKDKVYWEDVLKKTAQEYATNKETWWEQPESLDRGAFLDKLNIPKNSKIVLFAGQVDNDTQTFKYSPLFENNLNAFKWFCENVPKEENIFILGKHHPKSDTNPEEYRKIVKGKGVWLDDAALSDCLAVSSRVVAVNSTVLFEGLLTGKPILSMGKSLLSGKDVSYEINSLDGAGEIIKKWLHDDANDDHKRHWEKYGALLLSKSLYSVYDYEKKEGKNGSCEMAGRLQVLCAEKANGRYRLLKYHKFLPRLIAMEIIISISLNKILSRYKSILMKLLKIKVHDKKVWEQNESSTYINI